MHILQKVQASSKSTKEKLRVTRACKGVGRKWWAYRSLWTTQSGKEQMLTDGVLWSLSSFLSACRGAGSSFSTPGEAANASTNLDRRHASVSTQGTGGSEQLLSSLLRHSKRGLRVRQQHLVPSHHLPLD